MSNIIINGAMGKMGQEAVKAVENDPNLVLVAKTDMNDNLKDIIIASKSNIVVDLTHPSSVFENSKIILNNNNHAVIGTTGLTDKELKELEKIAIEKNKLIIICPNFAISAILMMRFSQEAAKFMDRCEIIEYHHDKKADAPSGTAIKTAQLINEKNSTINNETLTEKELLPGSRGAIVNNIPIHAIRIPGVVANQEVIFGTTGQSLTIRHDTISREAFMPGLILAIKATATHTGLIYGLENII
ncbi:MAG: 4-hydroxy-tetrahydrodipicolinate reductase [Rickettsiales bacterium]|nr:4-hydroxy-tetrahydrodipicolinate reductase [Rickettsiales bacterium]|tara:strand:+ start:1100 stop:1831 length:732 start_codon:yes stop_codon:yes gene_type:complete